MDPVVKAGNKDLAASWSKTGVLNEASESDEDDAELCKMPILIAIKNLAQENNLMSVKVWVDDYIEDAMQEFSVAKWLFFRE